ncbi:Permease of the drug/metabolite transporter (DMT) superfamily [Lachnospiraceae bacterium]|nr:Permease of the drug/metabolite transporter (DMT) superfamily [Lachnospiraceae bacterium]
MKKSTLGNGLLLLTAFIWGTAFVAQRVGMDSIEPITFNAARMALAAIAVGAVAFILGRKNSAAEQVRTPEKEKKYRKYTITGGILCGIFLSIASILQQMGIVYTTAGKAGFITAMYMLLVPSIGFIAFKRKNTWLVWLAVLLGVIGMYFLCITEKFTLSYGDTLVCGCALFFSGHILCCDYFAPRGNAILISAIQFAAATVVSSVVALITEAPSMEKLISAAVPILYCGIMSGGLGYTLQIVGQKYTDPTIASLLMSMESVFAVIAGVIILNEKMTGREVIGCIVMFTAIILVQIPLPQKRGGSDICHSEEI